MILIILIIVFIIQATISFIVWSTKTTLKLKRNEPVRYISKNRAAKYRELILSIIMLSFIIINTSLPYIHTDDIEGARYSSKSFLASSATYDYISKNGSEVNVDVFKSDYDFIIDQYIYSKTHSFFKEDYNTVNLPGWNSKSSFLAGSYYYIEFENFVISFSDNASLTPNDIEQIKSLVAK